MPPAEIIRRRISEKLHEGPRTKNDVASLRCDSLRRSSSPPAATPVKTWRYLLRWIARILLPVAFILSKAKVVLVENASDLHIDDCCHPNATLLLVIAHARPDYLERCLASILGYHPGDFQRWPVVVSIDGQDGKNHADVKSVVKNAQAKFAPDFGLHTWLHDETYDDQGENDWDTNDLVDIVSYRRISRHYRWALTRAFGSSDLPKDRFTFDRVVIVEEDMEVAIDFFNYFDALAPVLINDPTLLCVSAWNDNGKANLVSDASQLHRTDFFPGLGWMLTRQLWDELRPNWPAQFWDDWLREPAQSRGRHCIRPEISRTINFGAKGASQSFDFEKHVSKVILNSVAVNFSSLDLTYLESSRYETLVFGRMSRAVLLKYSNYLTSRPQDADVIARYPQGNIVAIGKRTGVMTDHRDGVFRTSFRGVVIIPWNGHWAFLVEKGWTPPKGYSLGSKLCCDGLNLVSL